MCSFNCIKLNTALLSSPIEHVLLINALTIQSADVLLSYHRDTNLPALWVGYLWTVGGNHSVWRKPKMWDHHTERNSTRTFLLWGDSANHCNNILPTPTLTLSQHESKLSSRSKTGNLSCKTIFVWSCWDPSCAVTHKHRCWCCRDVVFIFNLNDK